MARIRTIKPSFFTSLPISRLAFDTRLTFIGLWTHCDDEGRCVFEPRLIKAALWPLDDSVTAERVAEMVGEMQYHSLVVTYGSGDARYLQVVGFQEHQHINRPVASKYPPPPVELTEDSVSERGDLTAGREGKGKEGKQEGKGSAAAAALREQFVSPDHVMAYAAYCETPTRAVAVDAVLRTIHQPITGGARYEWPVIGQALVEMRGASVPFTAQAVRRFCEKLVQGSEADESPAQASVRRALAAGGAR